MTSSPSEHSAKALRLIADTTADRWIKAELRDAANLIETLMTIAVIQQDANNAEAEVYAQATEAITALMAQANTVVEHVSRQNVTLLAENAGLQADLTSERARRARLQLVS